jgi:hypothetical protein
MFINYLTLEYDYSDNLVFNSSCCYFSDLQNSSSGLQEAGKEDLTPGKVKVSIHK